MTEATDNFRRLKACLAKRLAPNGFTDAGGILWRKVRDTVVVIEIQKDRKSTTKGEIRFTVNTGISVNALRSAVVVDDEYPCIDAPPPERCHWRQRLGYLLPSQRDVWWSVSGEQSAQWLCDEIASGLIDIALPKIEALASSETLVRLWQEGLGQGLTEYERRVNLARLLVALGHTAAAQAAVQALEDAALGKSWAASASYDAKELRKQLS